LGAPRKPEQKERERERGREREREGEGEGGKGREGEGGRDAGCRMLVRISILLSVLIPHSECRVQNVVFMMQRCVCMSFLFRRT
jgi:hypothetical protein